MWIKKRQTKNKTTKIIMIIRFDTRPQAWGKLNFPRIHITHSVGIDNASYIIIPIPYACTYNRHANTIWSIEEECVTHRRGTSLNDRLIINTQTILIYYENTILSTGSEVEGVYTSIIVKIKSMELMYDILLYYIYETIIRICWLTFLKTPHTKTQSISCSFGFCTQICQLCVVVVNANYFQNNRLRI